MESARRVLPYGFSFLDVGPALAGATVFRTPHVTGEAMLQLGPNRECCNADLPPDWTEARICSFECTFCASCADSVRAEVSELRRGFHCTTDTGGASVGEISGLQRTR